ncbi:MAG: CoA pyrophosphatase [Pseudomonadota bacterium]
MTGLDVRHRLARAAMTPGPPSSDYDLARDVVLPEGRRLRPAAVLVGVLDRGIGPELLLTKRSSRLKHHPGQIAFPGGKVDTGDAGPEAAALREADEEVGLYRENVEVLGTLPSHETVTGFTVTPVLGWIEGNFVPQPELGEVDEVFFAPLSYVTDPRNYVVEARRWRGQTRRYYAVPWGPYYIWGATARMLRGLSDRMTS